MLHETAGILLVCDSREEISATRAMLLDNGVDGQVVEAHDGVQALELLQPKDEHEALHPSVVLLDLKTPRMNGFDFLIHLRAVPATRDLPVVVLPTVTEQTPPGELFSGQEYAHDSTVPKPRTIRELLTALQALGVSWLKPTTDLGGFRLVARAS